MKNIVMAVIAVAILFMGTAGFARGFSAGMFGAYSIDGGNIEKSIEEEKNWNHSMTNPKITKCEYDAVEIPGAGAFAMYAFSNGLFIRAGAERYELKSGGNISKSVWDQMAATMINYDYEIEYKAMAFPVFFGISLSPDKGRTSFYMAAGIVTGIVEITRDTFLKSNMITNEYHSDNDTVIPGFAGVLGIDKKIIGNFSVMIEYAVYKCEKDTLESGQGYDNWVPTGEFDYKYTETYGLPTHQLRLGVKYEF